jgi:hypothetical protein
MPFARYAAGGIGPFVECPGAATEDWGASTATAVRTIRNPSASTATGTAMNAGTRWPIREVRGGGSPITFIRSLGRSGDSRYHPPPTLPAGLWSVRVRFPSRIDSEGGHLHGASRHGLFGPSGPSGSCVSGPAAYPRRDEFTCSTQPLGDRQRRRGDAPFSGGCAAHGGPDRWVWEPACHANPLGRGGGYRARPYLADVGRCRVGHSLRRAS